MSAYIMPYADITIVRAFAGALQSIHTDYRLDMCDFLSKAFSTESFNRFEQDHTLFSQGWHCIAGKMLEEIKTKGESVKPIEDIKYLYGDEPVAYWLGYVIMYWKIKEEITDGQFFSEFSLSDIYWAYDILHTQSVDYAIDYIKEEYRTVHEDI